MMSEKQTPLVPRLSAGNKPFIPSGVIFDLDGTLLDTERFEIDIFLRVAPEMGYPVTEDFLRSRLGYTAAVNRRAYLDEYGGDFPFEGIWARVKEIETETGEREGLPHKKGLLTLLNKLRDLRVPMAVATSTERSRASWKLRVSGIENYFTALACGDEISRGKPSPDIFLLAAKRLGAESGDCVGFEDSGAGLTGLAAAGIPSVFVRDITRPSGEALAGVWKQCANLAEAAELFG